MVEKRVDITVGASTEGFEQVQRDAEKLTQSAAKAAAEQAKGYQQAQQDAARVSAAVNKAIEEQKTGMASVQKSTEAYQTEVRTLEGRLGELKVQQQATVRAMLDVDKATPAWAELKKSLQSTNEDIKLTEAALNMLSKSVVSDDGAATAANKLVEGFTKARQSQRAYRNEIRTLKRELRDLAKEQSAVAAAIGKTEKGSEAYKILKTRLRDVGERSRETETRLKAVERATGRGMPLTEADMAKGAFIQGLTQGAFPGIGPIQRGPGMRAQLVGSMIGRGARGAVQGLFGGVQGMQQMLAAAPLPGAGVLAAQFGQGMAFAGGGLQQQAARFRAAPMLGGIREVSGRVEAARMAARRQALARSPELSPAQIEREVAAARERATTAGEAQLDERMRRREDETRMEREAPGGTRARMSARELEVERRVRAMQAARDRDLETRRGAREQELLGRIEGEPTDAQRRATGLVARGEQQIAEKTEGPRVAARMREIAEADTRREMEKGERGRIAQEAEAVAQRERETLESPRQRRLAQEQAAARRARRQMFAPIRAAGREMGALNEQQAIQAAQAMVQGGAGSLGDLQQQGMLRTGIAAQTAYGVGPGVAGAFTLGGRTGGVVGAQGRAGEAMAESIGQAVALNLKGPELVDYMQQMADGMQTWKSTGMPINPKSIGQMATEFAQTGLGGIRGGVMGRGMMQGLQRIGQEGITGGVDLLAAQTFGGFKGGGLGDFWETQKRLEAGGGEGGFTADQMREFIGKAMGAGGGGTGGLFTLRETMRKMGVQMSAAETEQLAAGATAPGEMTPEQRAKMEAVRGQMAEAARGAPKTGKDVQADAQAMVNAFGKELKRAASLQNQQNDVGEKLVPIFQNLQKSSLTVNNVFTDLAKGPLKSLSDLSVELTGNLEKLNAQFQKVGKSGALDLMSKIATSFF